MSTQIAASHTPTWLACRGTCISGRPYTGSRRSYGTLARRPASLPTAGDWRCASSSNSGNPRWILADGPALPRSSVLLHAAAGTADEIRHVVVQLPQRGVLCVDHMPRLVEAVLDVGLQTLWDRQVMHLVYAPLERGS